MGIESFCAFGLSVTHNFPLPGLSRGGELPAGLAVDMRLVAQPEVEQSWTGNIGPAVWETTLTDGRSLRHEIGVGGDHRFTYGRATFHITADGGTVLCAPGSEDTAAWQRQLLDTVLFAASFIQGSELLHAAGIEFEAGVIAVVGTSGRGKSSLAAEFVRRGRALFCDDVLALRDDGEGPACHPGPAVMNLPRKAGAPSDLGASLIAQFGSEDELWVELDIASQSPRRLAAVYVLQQGGAHASISDATGATSIDLLRHAITLPHDQVRARRRFELFSAVADSTPIRHLHMATAPPAALADLVEASLDRSQVDRTAQGR